MPWREAFEQGDHAGAGHVLKPAAKEQLGRVRSLLAVPAGVPLDAAAWYELLASQHYLLKVSHYDATQAKQTIAQQKRHLSDWLDRGIDALRQHGLI